MADDERVFVNISRLYTRLAKTKNQCKAVYNALKKVPNERAMFIDERKTRNQLELSISTKVIKRMHEGMSQRLPTIADFFLLVMLVHASEARCIMEMTVKEVKECFADTLLDMPYNSFRKKEIKNDSKRNDWF